MGDFLRNAIIYVGTAVTIVMSIFIFYTLGPLVETKYFPVVSKLNIVDIRRSDKPGHTIIQAEFTKLRNCEYLGISWYRGDRMIGFERVPLTLYRAPGDQASPNRPVGTQQAGPWEIAMPMEEVLKVSFAQLYHKCWPFWTTVTDFYP